MCGIAGAVVLSGSAPFEEVLSAVADMSASLTHRGPDDSGSWSDPPAGVAFGHTRLAIVDLTSGGHQPMVSASGRIVVVYNGEIYNHRRVRGDLESLGVRFRGASDTEVLVEALATWGIHETLDRITGMFAFAAWDREERCLHLARDRIGEKPLYFSAVGGCFSFASELGALAQSARFDGRIDRDVAALYLQYGYVPEPYTIFQGVSAVAPGQHVRVDRGADTVVNYRQYWSAREAAIRGATEPFGGSLDDAADELETRLKRAVRDMLIADVPIGATLSGGVDSSTVVAMMGAVSPVVPRTFTIGFDDASSDESAEARAIALYLGTSHTELRVSAADALDSVPIMPGLFGQPFGDASQIPSYIVSRLMREQVTVALTGDGGDELFGGYDRYRNVDRFASLSDWAPYRARQGLAWTLRAAVNAGRSQPKRPGGRRWSPAQQWPLARKMNTTAQLLADRGARQRFRRLLTRNSRALLLVPGAAPPLTPIDDGGGWMDAGDDYQAMAYVDLVTYLPSNNLVKMDRASMAHGLEVRTPLLDTAVVEFALSLPAALRVGDGLRKRTLRRVLQRHVPDRLVQRTKRGFTPPVGSWLRGPLRDWGEDLLADHRVRADGIFDPVAVRDLWTSFLNDRATGADAVWDLLMFQGWLQSRPLAHSSLGATSVRLGDRSPSPPA